MAPAEKEFDDLAPYLEGIRGFPPLSREEEHALALRARMGDVAAKQKLVRHNLAFVVAFARKQRRGTVRLDDLVQEGNVGLLRAVDKFDPHAGTRFLTYAGWWIRAHIGKYLKEARSAVRPQSGTVAQADLSLDGAAGDEDETPLIERLEDESPSPESAYLSTERDRAVRKSVASLRKRIGDMGWDIVCNRLAQDAPRTLAEIGKGWGLSRERARQVEARTKHVLRRHLEAMEDDALDAAVPAVERSAA
jgi:RNA polymerase sigma factor (sigma-70 family)